MIYFCTAFAVALGESPERCNLFGLLGDFQRCLQCGSDKFPNKLWYFPLANIRAAASVLLPTSSALAFSVAASSALRIGLASPALSALPIGTVAYRTGSHSNPCSHDSTTTCQATVLRTSPLRFHRRSALPCHCQENYLSVHRSPTGFQPLRYWIPSSV